MRSQTDAVARRDSQAHPLSKTFFPILNREDPVCKSINSSNPCRSKYRFIVKCLPLIVSGIVIVRSHFPTLQTDFLKCSSRVLCEACL